MSAHLIVPTKDELQNDAIHLIPEEPALLPAQAGPVETQSSDRWSGILGLIGVAAILGLTLYSIVRYLL